MPRFTITTPIYYVNAAPHIGHAYTTIAGDAIARYRRLLGDDVYYLTGTDENAQKNVEAALARSSPGGGKADDTRRIVQQYVDEMSAIWQKTWQTLEISNDDFIRTTEERHVKVVGDFWNRSLAAGDIYKGSYEGLYCTGCESYKVDAELVNGLCPDHQRAPERLSEENYFFKLSKYKQAILDHIEAHPEFVQPSSRRNEITSYVRNFADDFSISRKNLAWGIPVPGDASQTIYVWFDALINYLSAAPDRWPADVHLVGKDIIKFHCAYWPAMLLSAGYALPKTIFAHGFFTIDGKKMSKTIGNVVDPITLVEKYGNDVVRYYLLREIPFGADGDFSTTRLVERYNSDLANVLGNLVSRTLTMAEKYTKGLVPPSCQDALAAEDVWKSYHTAMSSFALHQALEHVWELLRRCNNYIDEQSPWKQAKENPELVSKTLYVLLENLRQAAWMLRPFMPKTAMKIFISLGYTESDILDADYLLEQNWGRLPEGQVLHKSESLFPRL